VPVGIERVSSAPTQRRFWQRSGHSIACRVRLKPCAARSIVSPQSRRKSARRTPSTPSTSSVARAREQTTECQNLYRPRAGSDWDEISEFASRRKSADEPTPQQLPEKRRSREADLSESRDQTSESLFQRLIQAVSLKERWATGLKLDHQRSSLNFLITWS
jgi:hypothetical protein